mmetsp:Transcript_8676/g.24817  ORF Transcript_8676/g.24817 Transcript_8676/m.24817 type:complete len:87 (+) Transcript_8676:1830-2090(+)
MVDPGMPLPYASSPSSLTGLWPEMDMKQSGEPSLTGKRARGERGGREARVSGLLGGLGMESEEGRDGIPSVVRGIQQNHDQDGKGC